MQGPRRPRRGQEPGRGVYVVRRIVAVLAVLLLLVLLVPWVWQTLFGPGEEPGSEAPEVANVGDTGDEEAAMEEGPAVVTEVTEEIVVLEERAVDGSPDVVGLTAALGPPVSAAGGGETGGALGAGAAPDLAGAVPGPGTAAGNQQQAVQPIPSLEPSPFLEPVAFGGGIPFGEEAFFGEVPFEEEAFSEGIVSEDQGSGGVAVAIAGDTVAIAG